MRFYHIGVNVIDGRCCTKGHLIRKGEDFWQVRYGENGSIHMDVCAAHAAEWGWRD